MEIRKQEGCVPIQLEHVLKAVSDNELIAEYNQNLRKDIRVKEHEAQQMPRTNLVNNEWSRCRHQILGRMRY
jgi:hypothetical protein